MSERALESRRTPAVSVVVPLFNKADYIDEAIASVLAQTDPDFELIVVDDGSTDAGPERALQAAAADPRVRVLRQANAGVSAARNAGIEVALGRWVALLDADDLWAPAFLHAVRRAIDAHPEAVLVACDYAPFETPARSCGAAPSAAPAVAAAAMPDVDAGSDARSAAPRRADLMALWDERGGCPAHASAVAIRRDAIRRIGGFPVGMNLGEDLLTWIRLADAGPFVHVPEGLALYRVDATGSLARAPSRAAIARHADLLEAMDRCVAAGRCAPSIRDRQCSTHLFHLVNASQPRAAAAFLLRRPASWSIRHWSWVVQEALGVRRRLLEWRLAARARRLRAEAAAPGRDPVPRGSPSTGRPP